MPDKVDLFQTQVVDAFNPDKKRCIKIYTIDRTFFFSFSAKKKKTLSPVFFSFFLHQLFLTID